jgi:N-acylneuraminate cytidylyltransferase
MLGYVVRNALASGIFDEVFVSTDGEEIASVARLYGASVPELRPGNLSDDLTPTRLVIEHFISSVNKLQDENVVVACIYPFAILLSPDLIRSAKMEYESLRNIHNYLVAVQRYPHPIQRAFSLDLGGLVIPNTPQYFESRTQDLQEYFHDAGQFYFALSSTWCLNKSILANAVGFEISRYATVDIDNEEDLEQLQKLFAAKHNGQ